MHALRYRSALLLVLGASLNARAQSTLPKEVADPLWATWSDTSQADTTRLDAVHSFIVDGYLNSQPDSAYHYAQQQYAFAEQHGRKKQMAAALNTMGVSFYYRGDLVRAREHYERCLKLREEVGDEKGTATSLSNIGIVLANQGDPLGALEHYERSLVIRERIGDRKGIASSHNNIGNIYGAQALYPRALSHYERSLGIAEETGDKHGIATGLINLGNIQHALGDEVKALANYERSHALYTELGDPSGIVDCLINIGSIHGSLGHHDKALENFQRSLQVSREIGNPISEAISLNNLGNIHKDRHDDARALELYLRSLRISEELGDKRVMASTNITMGALYSAQGAYALARERCGTGLRLAEEIGAMDHQKNACACLYDVWKALGDDHKALAHHERMLALNDSLEREETARKLQQMEFARVLVQDSIVEAGERSRVQEQHAAEVQRKNRTRNVLVVTGAGVLLLALSLWGRLRYARRAKAALQVEKDRSENLLLNILPAEIAAELKEKGRAEARAFDQVSILFTDFKNFTETSARLSPTELVAEINHCFESFDGIVERHGIEKIKTIGDAYMAAGGLPLNTPDAAKRTVLAALDMQDFVRRRKAENEAQGRPGFDMRAGIHTGTVVAGIVGVKKFQYDIWGDTVNTASRMESSGEIGEVNVSEATYELVKEVKEVADGREVPAFTFTPRGKVQVKGKGEMEMYFVRRSHEVA